MNDLVTTLVTTAQQMVDGARKAIREVKGENAEAQQIYIPIIVGKTNLKITVESGPITEAANAIHAAQIASRQHPSMSREEAIQRAAHALIREASLLKESHTVPGQPEDWRGDMDAKENHDEMMQIAAVLLRGEA